MIKDKSWLDKDIRIPNSKATRHGNFIRLDKKEENIFWTPGTALGLVGKYENLGISRTFSKALGGAGIRVGYVVGSEELIGRLAKWRLMYEINQVGVKFASFLLDNISEVLKYAEQTKQERELLVKLLKTKGFDVIGSHTNSIHFHGKEKNKEIIKILKCHNVLFKSDTKVPFDAREDWVRLSIGPGLSGAPYIKKIIESCEMFH